MALRVLTSIASLALHLGFAAWLITSPVGGAFESGTGTDDFIIEQGIAIEGLSQLGQDATNVQAVEAEPLEASEARPSVEAVEAVEEVEETKVIASETGPEQELPETKPEPVVEPLPQQVATVEQVEQVQIEEKHAAGAEKKGGDADAVRKHKGQVWAAIFKNARSASRLTGTVNVEIVIAADGQLLTTRILKSSGRSTLDSAAIAAVERAAPFPPPPDTLGQAQTTYEVPFRFIVR